MTVTALSLCYKGGGEGGLGVLVTVTALSLCYYVTEEVTAAGVTEEVTAAGGAIRVTVVSDSFGRFASVCCDGRSHGRKTEEVTAAGVPYVERL